MENKSVEVNIYGEEITLISGEDEEYIREIAEYVDDKMEEIFSRRKKLIEKPVHKSILLGVNLTNEIFKARKEKEEIEKRIGEYDAFINSNFKETDVPVLKNKIKTLEDKNNELLMDLEKVAELHEKEADKYNKKLIELEKENNNLRELLDEKEKEAADAKKELEEFIDAFDENN